ncbi:MAG: hypothetical protein QOI76_1481, partial [Frankiales bacterium]|nr:hypothetical protein [Frankiales bacterium]
MPEADGPADPTDPEGPTVMNRDPHPHHMVMYL